MNPLPLMEGAEYFSMAPQKARIICEQRLKRTWKWLRTFVEFKRYRVAHVFSMTGVREGPRLVARRMLTELDVLAGCHQQKDADSWIALSDHAVDIHGRGGRCMELKQPYGISYECLLPLEISNLIVACRGAGFTHIAASSCRLTRTMMHLGHAAGIAGAIAHATQSTFPEIPPSRIRKELAKDNVILDPDDPIFHGVR